MKKAGILGGGQLGRMLLQAAANYPVETFVLENDPGCPSAHLCSHFINGNITNFDDVYNFGKQLDVLTIEIENVNEAALQKLEDEGIVIIPKPSALKIIKSKIAQKEFYRRQEIPSGEFLITDNRQQLYLHKDFLPAVHKLDCGGYDGKGVQVIEDESDLENGFDEPSVLEKKVNVAQELSVIIAVSQSGDTVLYDPVEMVMDPYLHLLSYQLSPARISESVLWKSEAIALKVVKALNSPGLFAVELFVDKQENIWVNETAPRVHNSGHHTIEACYSSQFDMLWRIMLDYPLGNTAHILPAAIVNLVGAGDYFGEVFYEGLENILSMDNVFVHLYGKKLTKPGRKMGHVTVLSNEPQELLHKASQIKQLLTVKAV